jgi:hypothetical protein
MSSTDKSLILQPIDFAELTQRVKFSITSSGVEGAILSTRSSIVPGDAVLINLHSRTPSDMASTALEETKEFVCGSKKLRLIIFQ